MARSRSRFSRKKTSSSASEDLIGNIPLNVLDQLTQLLYLNNTVDIRSPSRAWLDAQQQQMGHLDATLLRSSSKLVVRKNLLRKLAFFAGNQGVLRGSKGACLCSFHKKLNARMIRALMELVALEVTANVSKYRERREKHDLGSVLDAWLLRLESVSVVWMGKYTFERRLGYAAPLNSTGQMQRCEACILSFVGGCPQLLSDLRANLLARASARILRGFETPEPRLLRVVDSWVRWYQAECRVAIVSASDSTSQHVQVLDRQLEHKKKESEEKRKQGGKRHRRRKCKKMDRDEGGLPVPPFSKRRHVKNRLHINDDPSLAKIEGYVDCTSMSREGDYQLDVNSDLTQDHRRLFEEKKRQVEKEKWRQMILNGDIPLFSDDGDDPRERDIPDKYNGTCDLRPAHPQKSIMELERARDEGRFLGGNESEERTACDVAEMESSDVKFSGHAISSAIQRPPGLDRYSQQDDEDQWGDVTVHTYEDAWVSNPGRAKSGLSAISAIPEQYAGSAVTAAPAVATLSPPSSSSRPLGDLQPASASSFYSGTRSINTSTMPYTRQRQRAMLMPRASRQKQDLRARLSTQKSAHENRKLRQEAMGELNREALESLDRQNLRDRVHQWNEKSSGSDKTRKGMTRTVRTESLIGTGRGKRELNC